ncbi:MAG TPA: SurA N-terminal domain-containing protein [Caulobacterales bacterium]|nr:SurA N-terminal domain-containing protein [Caulobacterales bacterium]
MLRQIRGATRGWVSGVILFILAATFVIFLGAGNLSIFDAFVQPAGGRAVVTMAGGQITPAQLRREFENTLKAMRNNGQEISRADAVEQGRHRQALESLIEQRALADYTHRLGVYASDAQVGRLIRSASIFQNPLTGTFDRGRYFDFLREIQFPQDEFEREQHDAIAASMVIDALTSGVRAPSSFGALMLAYESERRTVSIAQAPAALAGNVAPPTDAQLQAYYREMTPQLQMPEYRTVTLIYARPSDFEARITVPEERIRQEFEARRASLTQPERRTFVQISAPDQARAQQAATRLGAGEAPEAVAHALGLNLVRNTEQARTAVADATVGAAVFAMAPGARPTAIRATLSPWAAVKLESITPAAAPNYEDQRSALRDEIARSEAADQMNDAMDAFETARSAGTALAQAAAANHLAVVNVPAVDQRGLTPEGRPADAFVDQPRLIQTAFQTNQGEAGEFMPLGDDGYVLLAVDAIRPAATRPLADVRSQLSQLWVLREKARRLEAIGNQVKEAVAGGQSFAAATRAQHMLTVVTSMPIDREAAQHLPARNLPGAIFTAHPGDVVSDMRSDGQEALVLAIVEDIQHAPASQAPQRVEQNRRQIQESIGQSLVDVISAAAIEHAKPKRNEAQIRRFTEELQGQTSQQQPQQ